MNKIYDKVVRLCTKKGITINRLEVMAGIGHGCIRLWAEGNSPSYKNLLKVADALGVSVDYLTSSDRSKY